MSVQGHVARIAVGINLGKCVEFNGSNSAVTFVAPTSFNPANLTQLTAAAWVYQRSAGGASAGRILDFSNGGAGKGFSMLVSGGTGISFQVNHTTANASANSPVRTFPVGVWKRALMTWDNANSVPTIYIDGIAVTPASTVAKSGSRVNVSGGTVHIGNRSALDRGFDGYIDEVCVWNRLMTEAEIREDFTKNIRPTSGLILRLGMNETSGSLVDSAVGITAAAVNATQGVNSYTTPSRTAID